MTVPLMYVDFYEERFVKDPRTIKVIYLVIASDDESKAVRPLHISRHVGEDVTMLRLVHQGLVERKWDVDMRRTLWEAGKTMGMAEYCVGLIVDELLAE